VTIEDSLQAMRAALEDADAEVVTDLGSHRETSQARVWRGQVLVDWEPDALAGGCLLRPALVERLAALHAQPTLADNELRIDAPGRIVAALSPEHQELVAQLGGARRLAMRATLLFADGKYRGGEEVYDVVQRGVAATLLRLKVRVSPRSARSASPRTSPAPT
jgi:hypothetical protein